MVYFIQESFFAWTYGCKNGANVRFLRLSFSFSRFLIIFAAGIGVYMIDLYVLTGFFPIA